MQKITLTTLLTCILLNSCAIHTKKELPIVPEIKYALSIGAEEKIPHLAPNSYPMYSDDSIYMVSEIRDDNYNGLIPTWVGNVCQVASMPIDADMTSEENPWTELGRITENMSGFPRNHNPGFLTDTKGYLPSEEKLVVFFTPAVTGGDWLWSYDLYSATFNLKKDKR